MVTITKLSKNYGKKVLFKNISLTINRGEKIGLIGSNGTGKSTLFYMILGETEPSAGEIQIHKNIHIGYLPQELRFSRPDNEGIPSGVGKAERSILAELTEGNEIIMRLRQEKKKLEDNNEAGSARYGEILHDLEALGYFTIEHKAKKILMGLGFKERDFNRPVSQMSGGWQMRVLLAKLLTYQYELLLLDEPTNYLDLNAVLWLRDYLATFSGTFIMISHDKVFLTEVTNYTLVLENGDIAKVRGNYEHYEKIREERGAFLLKQFKEQEKKRQQLQRFIDRFHAQPNKASAVRAKRTILEKMEKELIELPEEPRKSIRNFSFRCLRRSGYRVIRLEGVSKSYGDIKVYNDLNFEITQGEKAVLVGENGAGKSTLLKILAGVIPADKGRRILGHNVDIGYFSQTRTDVLNPENTVLEEAYSAAGGYMPQETIRAILGAFLFSTEDSDKKVNVLSGGEKSRLILAKLLINPPNFIILDEPTTHLDIDAVEALVSALKNYSGTIVFISHDIYFVRSIANMVFEVKAGTIRKFPESFDYYLEKKDKVEMLAGDDEIHKKAGRKIVKIEKERIEEEKKRELEREKEEENKRKIHNASIGKKIEKLKKEIEKLRLEHYAKSRALSNRRIYRDEDTLGVYAKRIKNIEKRISEARLEIKVLKSRIRT